MEWQQFISGLTAGSASTLILHPLDLLKTRFQGNAAKDLIQLIQQIHESIPSKSLPQYTNKIH